MAVSGKAGLIAAALAGGIVGGLAVGAIGGASATPGREIAGRYQLVAISGGVVRMDTMTGEMVGCLVNRSNWPAVVCNVRADTFEMNAAAFRERHEMAVMERMAADAEPIR